MIVSMFVTTFFFFFILMNIRYMFLKFDSNFLKHLVDDTLKSTMVLLFYSIRCWTENYIFSRRQKERETIK